MSRVGHIPLPLPVLNEVLSLNAQEFHWRGVATIRVLLLNEVLSLNAQEFEKKKVV